MRNYGVLAKGIKNSHADAILKNGYSIKVNYGTHTRIFNSIDEYEPSPGEIAALEEYKKQNGIKTKFAF
jgi:hypothetical protein